MKELWEPLPKVLKDSFPNFTCYLLRELGLADTPTRQQLRVCEWMQNGPDKSLTVAFRGLGKSILASFYALWRLRVDPNEKILVVSATAVKAMGGFFEGRLHFMDDSFKERALKMLGSDINNLWSADDLCRSTDSFFIASGVCSGWIPGVKFEGNKAEVTSKIIFGDSSETQIIINEYILGE